jgi:hypothetical protein
MFVSRASHPFQLRALMHVFFFRFDAAELLDMDKRASKANDPVSSGFYGIRLPDSDIGDVSGATLAMFYVSEGRSTDAETDGSERRINRRICVNLAAQVLSLLDVFIFPE